LQLQVHEHEVYEATISYKMKHIYFGWYNKLFNVSYILLVRKTHFYRNQYIQHFLF